MNTKDLKYYIAVCQYKNITNAAKALYISQQTLSASISRLEQELNTTLFNRSQKGVELTKSGQYLYIEAKKMISIEKDIGQYMNMDQNLPVNLQIGIAYGVVHEYSNILFDTLRLSNIQLRIKFVEYTDLQCEKAVERGDVELGFGIGPIDTNSFEAKKIISRKFCFLIPKDHPLASQNEIEIQQLKDEGIIMLNEQFKANHIFTSLCEANGFVPNIIFEAGEIAPIQSLVRKKYGIGISTDFISNNYNQKELKIMYLKDFDYSWDVYLIWKKGRKLSKNAIKFIDYIEGK